MTRDVDVLVALWARADVDTEERALGWWLGELDEPILDAHPEPRRYAYDERETSGFEPAAAQAVRKAVAAGVMSEEKGQRIIGWLVSVAADTSLLVEYRRNDPDFGR